MPIQDYKPKNTVFVEGYLKENLLVLTNNRSGDEIIKGSIVIATDEFNSYKLQFYVTKTLSNGEESEDFKKVLTLLPSNTQTIASFLKSSEKANWAVAANASTKVWAIGRFEEYAVTKDGKEHSSVLLKGRRCGIKSIEDRSPFNPRTNFNVEMYIENKQEEEKDGTKTGRMILTGLIPMYNGCMQRIDFVVESPKAVQIIEDKYNCTQTANLEGILRSTQKQVAKGTVVDSDSWGSAVESQYETTFIRERVITGGKPAIDSDADGAITKAMVKEGLKLRDELISKNTSKPSSTTREAPVSKPAATPAPASVKDTPVTGDYNFEDEDF